MKKSLVALAALAFIGVASAQSSVTLFGVVDTAVSGYSNKSENPFGSAKISKSALSSSGYNASRLGFRGTEDLGGGLAASFWLEAGLNTDTGAGAGAGGGLTFNRRSTVSLSGNFGEIRLGRDYVPTFWNDTVFDPFGTNGVGNTLINRATNASFPGYSRASNSVAYFLPPNLGGFYGQLTYAFSEKLSYSPAWSTPAGDTRSGRYIGGRVGYANGPLDVALAYGEQITDSSYYLGTTTNNETWNLGASYDFGVVKLFGEYANVEENVDYSFGGKFASDPKFDGWLIGASVPIGAGLIRASYSGVKYKNSIRPGFTSNPKADQFALGYVYNLSKRTALYTTVAYLKNKNGSDLSVNSDVGFQTSSRFGPGYTPKTSTGYDIGVRHSF